MDDHWIQWPHTQGTAMLPVLMRCPREVKFSGKETVSFDCTITGVNDAAMDVTYRLGRIDGATRINGEVVHVQQVRLGASSSPGLSPPQRAQNQTQNDTRNVAAPRRSRFSSHMIHLEPL